MNEKEWLDYFESVNNRKPTAEEVSAARAAGDFTASQGEYQSQLQQVQPQGSTFGWAVLGFFFPLIGLILFLVWKGAEVTKKKAKSAGKGALIGVITYVALSIIALIISIALFGTQSNSGSSTNSSPQTHQTSQSTSSSDSHTFYGQWDSSSYTLTVNDENNTTVTITDPDSGAITESDKNGTTNFTVTPGAGDDFSIADDQSNKQLFTYSGGQFYYDGTEVSETDNGNVGTLKLSDGGEFALNSDTGKVGFSNVTAEEVQYFSVLAAVYFNNQENSND